MKYINISRYYPIIVIIGKANVGKSTLFNYLAQKKLNIITSEAGTTRDYSCKKIIYEKECYTLIDTAGLYTKILNHISLNVELFNIEIIKFADIILFMLDINDEISEEDFKIVKLLNKYKWKVIILINKCDSLILKKKINEFDELFNKKAIGISAQYGLGINFLFNEINNIFNYKSILNKVVLLKDLNKKIIVQKKIIISVLGKPNTGKSTFINNLLGSERLIMSNIPGTTLDSVDTYFYYKNIQYIFIDTAGVKKKKKMYSNFDTSSFFYVLKSIDKSNLIYLMIDSTIGVTNQDLKLASIIKKKKKGVLLLINKWDLCKAKDKYTLLSKIREDLPFLSFVPIRFISALKGSNLTELLDDSILLMDAYNKRISTSKINKWLFSIIKEHIPPQKLKFYFISQIKISPPVFIILCNNVEYVHFAYNRYLINKLRKFFMFRGVPLDIFYQNKDKV